MAPYYEPGTYLAAIIGQGFTEAKTGTMQFCLRIVPKLLLTSDGEEHAVTQEYERTIFRPITDKTVGWVLEELAALGWQGTKWVELDPQTEGYHSFVGQETKVMCQHEEYEGSMQERWRLFGEGREIVAVPPDKLRRLDDAFGRAIKDFRKGNPAPASTPAPTAPVTTPEAAERDAAAAEATDDSDIPF